MTREIATPETVVRFWQEAGPERWFASDAAFDQEITERFGETYRAAMQGELDDWETQPLGSLALLILLDQFPRNMFRGTREAYRTDATALLVAERAIDRDHDKAFEAPLRRFFYLPFTHAEDPAMQERAVRLNEEAGDQDGAQWARHHQAIVTRFGRFPHRNAILGRDSTAEERAFLEEEGAFRG